MGKIKNSFEVNIEEIPAGIATMIYDRELKILNSTNIFKELILGDYEKAKTQELTSLFPEVYSGDLISVNQQLAEQFYKGKFRIKFRVLHHDGNIKWLQLDGARTKKIHELDGKKFHIHTCIITDISNEVQRLQKLEKDKDDSRIISDLSEELNYEYWIANDTLWVSKLFNDTFGKTKEIKGFRGRLESTNLVHKDDLPLLKRNFTSMMAGRKKLILSMRLINKAGKAIPYVCYAIIVYDENHNPHKVIGKLVPIRAKESNSKELFQLPRKETSPELFDLQSGFYTKSGARRAIAELMKEQEEDAMSSLMILEIKEPTAHRKLRRDVLGKNALSIMRELIRRRFRETDIIGRLDLGKFIIFVRDISSDRIVYQHAEELCAEVDSLFSYKYGRPGEEINIGVTFIKGNEESFEEVFNQAHEALKIGKKDGNHFEVYGKLN